MITGDLLYKYYKINAIYFLIIYIIYRDIFHIIAKGFSLASRCAPVQVSIAQRGSGMLRDGTDWSRAVLGVV